MGLDFEDSTVKVPKAARGLPWCDPPQYLVRRLPEVEGGLHDDASAMDRVKDAIRKPRHQNSSDATPESGSRQGKKPELSRGFLHILAKAFSQSFFCEFISSVCFQQIGLRAAQHDDFSHHGGAAFSAVPHPKLLMTPRRRRSPAFLPRLAVESRPLERHFLAAKAHTTSLPQAATFRPVKGLGPLGIVL